jgi:hypothetical protein
MKILGALSSWAPESGENDELFVPTFKGSTDGSE